MDRGRGGGGARWAVGSAVQGLSLALKIGEPCLLRMGQHPEPSPACCHLGLEERQSRRGLDTHRHRGRGVHYIPERGTRTSDRLENWPTHFLLHQSYALPSIISCIIASTERVPGG